MIFLLHTSLDLPHVDSLSIAAAKAIVEEDAKETVATEAVSPLIPNAFEVSCSTLHGYDLHT